MINGAMWVRVINEDIERHSQTTGSLSRSIFPDPGGCLKVLCGDDFVNKRRERKRRAAAGSKSSEVGDAGIDGEGQMCWGKEAVKHM